MFQILYLTLAVCFANIFIKALEKSFKSVSTSFHGGGDKDGVKFRLGAIAKSAIGILFVVTRNSISTRKTEIFWGVQKSLIYLLRRGGISETHQVYYLNGSITVIILI